MPAQKDYYSILGVSREASQDEVRKAYHKLAHKYHPDKTGGDKEAEDKLKEINAAYNVLRNPEKRAKYDRFGAEGEQFAGAGGGFGGFGGGTGFGDFAGGGFDDIFEAFFGGGRSSARQRTAAQPGSDLEYRTSITLQEAAFGVNKTISFTRQEQCSECRGSGASPGSEPHPCRDCGGTGQVRMTQGFFSVARPCPQCRGTGQYISDPCRNCSGSGRVQAKRELTVDIPAGVDSGSRLRMSGEGEAGRHGGPRGDLYILIEVKPDKIFTRDGNNVICEVPVSLVQAALGDTIRVPTLKGEAELKIPAGTQSDTPFKMRGLGMPDLRGYRQGDQYVRVKVETPTKLTKEQKELLRQFDELSDSKTYPLHRRFVDALKEYFGA